MNDAEILKKILEMKNILETERVIVIFIANCSVEEFEAALTKVSKFLKKNDLFLFFFAGHAWVVNNCPTLLTIPKPKGRKFDVERDSVNVYRLLSRSGKILLWTHLS